jgi:hypothetical protein
MTGPFPLSAAVCVDEREPRFAEILTPPGGFPNTDSSIIRCGRPITQWRDRLPWRDLNVNQVVVLPSITTIRCRPGSSAESVAVAVAQQKQLARIAICGKHAAVVPERSAGNRFIWQN